MKKFIYGLIIIFILFASISYYISKYESYNKERTKIESAKFEQTIKKDEKNIQENKKEQIKRLEEKVKKIPMSKYKANL